jgi:hypothetical protein
VEHLPHTAKQMTDTFASKQSLPSIQPHLRL